MNRKRRVAGLIFILGLMLGFGIWQQRSQAVGQTRQGKQQLATSAAVNSVANPALRTNSAATMATITVQSLGDGAATAANCPGTNCRLRDAIVKAVAGDTIDFSVTGTITLTNGELVINKDLTIQGPGTALTISGNDVSRVFKIGGGVKVALHGLTVANGNTGYEKEGGGIYNQGDLALTYCTLTGNRTNSRYDNGSGNGGGIYNLGNLMLTHCTLTGNIASNEVVGRGGGIFNAGGTLTLINCTLSGNSASNKYGGCSLCMTTASGGGISNSSGSLTLINSTISGNSVSGVACFGCTVRGGGSRIAAPLRAETA